MTERANRYQELKQMLEEGLAMVKQETVKKMNDIRNSGLTEKRAHFGGDGGGDGSYHGDNLNSDPDIDIALLQMKVDNVEKYQAALYRLEEGSYGYCFDCGEEISAKRLRALPFAVRCKECEEAREAAAAASKRNRHLVSPLFSDSDF